VIATEGSVELYNFRVYDDGEALIMDWDDDTFTINPNTNLELQLRLRNDYNQTVDVYIESTLYNLDGDDLERSKSMTFSSNEKKTGVLEYYIPSSISLKTYELDIEYYYTINGTRYDHDRTFDVVIKEKELDTETVLINLTRAVVNEKETSNALLEAVINISGWADDWANCENKVGVLSEKEKYEALYFNESNTSRHYMESALVCAGEKKAMYTQSQLEFNIENEVLEGKRQQQKEDTNFYMMILGIGGVIWYFKRKKETVGGEGPGKSLTGTWK